MKKITLASLLLLFCALCAPFILDPAYAFAPNSRALIKYINDVRESRNLPPLRHNARLDESSKRKIREMSSRHYFGHTNPAGKPFETSIRAVGYRFSACGEILARGCDSEECYVDLWVGSDEHRHIILDPEYLEIGCGAFAGGSFEQSMAVCHFGTPVR